MIKQITIQKPGYQDFTLSQLTNNNLLICSSPALKNKVSTEIEQLWLLPDDGDSSLLYVTERPDDIVALDTTKRNIRFSETTISNLVENQKFVFTTEPAFLYAAKDWYDIWFISEENGQIKCHAFCEFVGAKDDWLEGLDTIFFNFVQGKYGCYLGCKNTNKGTYETSIGKE